MARIPERRIRDRKRPAGDIHRPCECRAGTHRWHEHLRAGLRRQGEPPPYVATAFLLQYALGGLAAACATATAVGPWAVDPREVTLDVAMGGYPAVVGVGTPRPANADGDLRLGAAHTAYRAAAEPFALGLDVGTHLGRHQRLGMVTDAWRMALRDLHEPGRVVEREACCYIYRLPGCAECGGCPRLRH